MNSRTSLRKKKKRKKIVNRICLIVSLILLLTTILFTYKIFQINMLPNKYLIPVIILIGLFDAIVMFFLLNRGIKIKFKIGAFVLVTLIFIIDIAGYFYIDKAYDFINTIKPKGIKTEIYSVLVLEESEIKTVEDLKDKSVSYVKTVGNSHKAMEELKKKVSIISNNKTDVGELVSGLLNKSITAILIEDSYIEMIKDQYQEEGKDFDSLVKSIYKISVEVKEEEIAKEVDVLNDTFTLYISGIDITGPITTVSRSDVNIVAVVNPKTKQVLLISIPRDYYVKLHGIETDMRDKLTHAGMYGINTSVKTVEDLLDIDINYYLKVNFTTVIDVVNALGGIDVESKYAFNTFKKGINHLNGDKALEFCRERKSFTGGDRVRGQNQQAVITAIIKKAATPAIVTMYGDVLNSMEGKFETNIGTENISKLIKMQLNDMASWSVKSISLDGTDSSNYTYSYPKSMGNAKNYVMEPKLETIKRAQELINDIKGNLILDLTDENKVYKTYNYSTPTSQKSNTSSSSNKTSVSNSSSISSNSSMSQTSISKSNSSSNSSNSSKSSSMSHSSSSSSSSNSISSISSVSSSSSMSSSNQSSSSISSSSSVKSSIISSSSVENSQKEE